MAPATTLLTLDEKGRASLPEDIRSALGVAAGDRILLERTERGTFELLPVDRIPEDQRWFHHREMQDRVAEAEADFAAGRTVRTESPEQAQALLDRLKADGRSES